MGQADACAAHLKPDVGRWRVHLRIGAVRALGGQNVPGRKQRKGLFRRIVVLGRGEEIGLRLWVEQGHRGVVGVAEQDPPIRQHRRRRVADIAPAWGVGQDCPRVYGRVVELNLEGVDRVRVCRILDVVLASVDDHGSVLEDGGAEEHRSVGWAILSRGHIGVAEHRGRLFPGPACVRSARVRNQPVPAGGSQDVRHDAAVREQQHRVYACGNVIDGRPAHLDLP